MRSTMMDSPLTVTALMRYGTSAFADREVRTWTGDSSRSQSYGETGARAASSPVRCAASAWTATSESPP